MDNTLKTQKFPFGKIIITAIVCAVLGQIIHTIGAMITMSFYLDSNYFSVWSKIMMPGASAPPLSFTLISLGFALINGLIFASVYAVLKNSVPGRTLAKKGLIYGLLVFLLAGITTSLTLILLINLPIALLIYWAFESLMIYLLMGLITTKIIK